MSAMLHIETALAKLASDRVASRRIRGSRLVAPHAAVTETAFGMPEDYRPFSIGSLGNFPYYWQDPRTLQFNAATYQWITSGLRAGCSSVQLDGVFTNRFTTVLSKIVYSLSTADQASLVATQQQASNEQRLVLQAWKDAFGRLPTGAPHEQPINLVFEEITTQWASPPTSLNDLLAAADPVAALNRTPAAGSSVIPVLLNYLIVLNATVPLLNKLTHNTGLLKAALGALQTPTLENGALQTTEGFKPAYEVKTPIDSILSGLSDTSTAAQVQLELDAIPRRDGRFDIRPRGAPPAAMHPEDLLAVKMPTGGKALTLASSGSSGKNTLMVTFPGVTTVSFGPVGFCESQLKDWFWPDPVIDALKNGARDVTGFKFSSPPNLDFSEQGPFGFVEAAIISLNPSIRVTTTTQEATGLRRALTSHTGGELLFLGRSLGRMGSKEDYSIRDEQNETEAAVTLVPAAAGPKDRAFVLGVKTVYPGARSC